MPTYLSINDDTHGTIPKAYAIVPIDSNNQASSMGQQKLKYHIAPPTHLYASPGPVIRLWVVVDGLSPASSVN